MKFFKKIGFVYLITLLFLTNMSTFYAQGSQLNELPVQSILLINGENGQILFDKNSNEILDVGSSTKLLLAYIVLNKVNEGKINLEDIVNISDEAYLLSQDYEIPNVPLRQDFEYTVEELLTAVAVKNANGAALALVEHVSKNSEDFLSLMESQLKDWKLNDFQLIDVLGLPNQYKINESDSQFSGKTNRMSALTLATIAYRMTADYSEFLSYSSIETLNFKAETDDPFSTQNNNEFLLDKQKDSDGLIIGYAPNNGYTQVISSKKDGQWFIAVLVGVSSDIEDSYMPVGQLLDYGFSEFEKKYIVQENQLTSEIPVIKIDGGTQEKISSIYSDSIVLSIPKGENEIKIKFDFIPNKDLLIEKNYLSAPINKGDKLGEIQVGVENYQVSYLPTSTSEEVSVLANESVEENSFFAKLFQQIIRMVTNLSEAIRKFFTNLFN